MAACVIIIDVSCSPTAGKHAGLDGKQNMKRYLVLVGQLRRAGLQELCKVLHLPFYDRA